MARFDSNVAIRIAADFVGLPAFKKADTAVDKLYKGTKKLAGAFGVAFSAQAITRFAATSIRAFAAEEKQIAALTSTVKSLGLAFTAPAVNDFIENLERTTGIVREELQPAFQKLLTQTGSITKSQEILSAAVKVSFSGLMSTSEAADALTQAYVGNTKGLKKFNLGLTNAELSALSFEQVLQKVTAAYKNQFNAAQDTTQVKIDKFNVAVGNAIENIGGGLVDAFAKLAGNGDLEKANSLIEDMSVNLADAIRNANLLSATQFFVNPLGLAAKSLLPKKEELSSKVGMGGSYFTYKAQQAKLAAAEAKALAKAKKLENDKLAALRKQTAEKKAQAALDKANAKLDQAENVFNLERISVAAAQNNATLTENERKRLEIKQAIFNLEDAIASKDTAKITAATTLLNGLLGQFAVMQRQAGILEQIKANFDALGLNKDLINLNNLSEALRLIEEMTKKLAAITVGGSGGTGGITPVTPKTTLGGGTNVTKVYPSNQGSPVGQGTYLNPSTYGANPSLAPTSLATGSYLSGNYYSMPNAPTSISSGAYLNPPAVNITIDGSVNDLIKVVVDGLQNQNASGISTNITRNTGGFNW